MGQSHRWLTWVTSRAAGLTLTGVTVQRHSEEITVIIRGHGPFRYQMVSIDSSRLAMDFPGGVSSLSFQLLSVENHLLKQIRIGQHPNKLRLVFDVTQPLRYAVKRGSNFLAIRFKS